MFYIKKRENNKIRCRCPPLMLASDILDSEAQPPTGANDCQHNRMMSHVAQQNDEIQDNG